MTIVGPPGADGRASSAATSRCRRSRRARASRRCAPATVDLAVTFALDALDEPLTPDIARRLRSADAACRSPASGELTPPSTCRARPRSYADQRQTRRRAGGGDASTTSRLRARHRDRHHGERPRPSGRRRRHRRPRRPRLRRGVHRPGGAAARRPRRPHRPSSSPASSPPGTAPPSTSRSSPTGPPCTACRSACACSTTAPSRCAGRRCPGHRGAYRASWFEHGHLDAYRLYRGDVGPALRISCSLKSIARFVGPGAHRGRPHQDPRPLQRGAPRLRRQRRPPGPHPHRAPLGHGLPLHRPRRTRRRRPARCAPSRGAHAIPA